jgi:hypothetical protein
MSLVNNRQDLIKLILHWVAPGIMLVGLSIFVIASTLVGFFPETFGPMFSSFISYEKAGIYADCSLSENKRNRICSGTSHTTGNKAHERTWNSLQGGKKAMPFTLHGN